MKRKAEGADNMLARVIDWHERSSKEHIKKNEEAVSSMERALEILDGYLFVDDRPPVEAEIARIKWLRPCATRSPRSTSLPRSSRRGRKRRLWARGSPVLVRQAWALPDRPES